MIKQIPNPELFVVYFDPKDKAEVSRRLASTGSIEELDNGMLLLRVATKASQPEAQWRQLSELLASLAKVLPVLFDEQGHNQYPTGDLTVRFSKKPSDKQLQDFAGKYRLRLRDRNEFVPEQAAFQVNDPAVAYLPDLLQQIAADKDIKSAWASTRSRYTRLT